MNHSINHKEEEEEEEEEEEITKGKPTCQRTVVS